MKYQSELPQLVIMDIRMPGTDGIDVLNAIRGKARRASVVINTFPQYRGNVLNLGAEANLIKSSDLRELKQKVREVLNNRPSGASVPNTSLSS